MKNAIQYYYSLNIDYIHFYHQRYYFKYAYKDYVLVPYKRSQEEIVALYELNVEVLSKNNNFHQIILNKDKSPVTVIEDVPYVLLKMEHSQERLLSIDDIYTIAIKSNKKLETLNRFSWTYLWAQKIDYLEYQIEHLELEFPALAENMWYFIGIGENAISYIQNTLLESTPTNQDELSVSRRRISAKDELFDYYNPLNFVLDHPTRDISEFLKSCFFDDTYDLEIIEDYFERVTLSDYGYRLLFGRMLFPSLYFDNYQKMVENELTEKEVLYINSRIQEYELFLNDIYIIIKRYSDIPPVDWLIKKSS